MHHGGFSHDGGRLDSHFKERLARADLIHLHEGVAVCSNATPLWTEVLELKEDGCT